MTDIIRSYYREDESLMQPDIQVPNCGQEGIVVSSYRPWGRSSFTVTLHHRARHFAYNSVLYAKKHIFFEIWMFFTVTLASLLFFIGEINLLLLLLALAIIVGSQVWTITTLTSYVLRRESLQVWFREAYGLNISYDEASSALDVIEAGAKEFNLSNNGRFLLSKHGIIYEETATGFHHHI